MSRSMSAAILVLAVLAVAAGIRFSQQGGGDEGCDGVRQTFERVSFVERGGDVQVSADYRRNATEVRRAAIEAPAAVAQDLRAVGDAYATMAQLLQGFDPNDDSTYHVIEDNTAAIESQQANVDAALPSIEGWLEARCM